MGDPYLVVPDAYRHNLKSAKQEDIQPNGLENWDVLLKEARKVAKCNIIRVPSDHALMLTLLSRDHACRKGGHNSDVVYQASTAGNHLSEPSLGFSRLQSSFRATASVLKGSRILAA